MPNARQGAAEPAQPKHNSLNNPEMYPEGPRQLFKWWGGSEHNSCLALVAEEETDGLDEVIKDISGLQYSQMYQVLCRALQRSLKEAPSDSSQAFALVTFAARLYRAGRFEGQRSKPVIP